WGPNRFTYTNGMLYNDSRVRLSDIADGATNTYMVGEGRYMQLEDASMTTTLGATVYWGSWASTYYYSRDGSLPVVVTAARDPINSSTLDPKVNVTHDVMTRKFGSHHAGGC